MRLLLVCFFALFSMSVFAADWTGTWDTRWRDGGARLELHQTGDKVEGVYAALGGTVEGSVKGDVFTGRWHQGPRSGGFAFVLASDGKSFGRYDTVEWWTGARATVDPNAEDRIDLSTPRAAMRTFLNGGNAARYDAPDEMVKSAAAVDFGDPGLAADVKLARTKTLLDLVDATTFRLFTIPDTPAGDQVSVTLHQIGTGAGMPVQFTKSGDA